MSDYRRPGVYLEERLQTQPTQSGSATAVGVFAGVAPKGDALTATRCDSWSDYVQKFGGFDRITVTDGAVDSVLLSYLPYAVFAYYQNGGRAAYIIRVLPGTTGAQGDTASVDVTDGNATTPATSFTVSANGAGAWGNDVDVSVIAQASDLEGQSIFGIVVRVNDVVVENFNNLSMLGTSGTRPVVAAINDPIAGSRYIKLTPGTTYAEPKAQAWPLVGGSDPGTPLDSDLTSSDVTDAIRTIDGPLVVSFQPFRKQDGTFVVPATSAITVSLNSDRSDIFVIWDGNPIAKAGSSYVSNVKGLATTAGTTDSYAAIYCPWIIMPDPSRIGATLAVPPSGSVQGVIARMDATMGAWRAPAGLPAVITTAVSAEVKFTDTDQGQLNYDQINVIRAVPGQGICIMGARTRKLFGPDRYISARRNLIYIESSLRISTSFAVFENNDARLWAALRATANNLLRPLWERGGLAGASAAQAFYVVCDATINTPQVVQSGEVRLEVGVALQYPAEFVVIRISQYDSGVSSVSDVAIAVS